MHKMLKSLCLVALFGSVAHGALITIDNPSFETPAIGDGLLLTGRQTICSNNPAPYNVPGCSGFGSSAWQTADNQSDSNGVQNPTLGATQGPSGEMFTYVPDGEQVAYSNGTPFFQILPVTIQANTTYTLTFYAGQRQDAGAPDGFAENQGYYAELSGGSDYASRTPFVRSVAFKPDHGFGVSNLNALQSNMPGVGQWIQVSLSYTFGASDPLIGQDLIIAFASGGVQAQFDMVTLDASPSLPTTTPEPSSYALMVAGLGALAFRHRRSKA